MNAIETAKSELIPALESLITLLEEEGARDPADFFRSIRQTIGNSTEVEDLADAFLRLSHAAFLGFEYSMAKCDEGYLCEVCQQPVEEIAESDLYLRYVIGMLDPETLHTQAERHLRCNPSLAQFIVDDRFVPVFLEGDFDKRQLDPVFVSEREQLVTRGWQRLQELRDSTLPIIDYPLDEVRASWLR